MNRQLTHAVIFLSLVVFGVEPSRAQLQGSGKPPFATFDHNGFDMVNLQNMNVHIPLSLYSRKGRGLDYEFGIAYNSPIFKSLDWPGLPTQWYGQGYWTGGVSHQHSIGYDTVQLNCELPFPDDLTTYTVYSNFTIGDTDGTVRQAFTGNGEINDQPYRCFGADNTRGYIGATYDLSGLWLLFEQDHYGNPTKFQIFDQDGTASGFDDQNLLYIDKNGNTVSNSISSTSSGQVISTLDTQGQVALTNTWPRDSAGNMMPVQILTYPTATGTAPTTLNQPSLYSGGLLSSIVLPNGQSYTFQYDKYGRITQATLPTGGIINYSYPGPNDGIFYESYNCGIGHPVCGTATTYALDREVDGVTTQYRTTHTGSGKILPDTTYVNYANGTTAIHSFDINGDEVVTNTGDQIVYRCSWWVGMNFCDDPNDAPWDLLRGLYLLAGWKSTQVINTEDNTSSNRLEAYDWLGHLAELREYDYGNRDLNASDRRKVMTWECCDLDEITENLTETQVYDHGTLVSDTQYSYDQTAVVPSPQPAAQLSPPLLSRRHNVTQISRWVAGGSWVTEHLTYFDTGNIASKQDENGNTTTFAYNACGESFLTSASYPGSLTESKTWECNSAQPASVTGTDGVTTNYTYGDPAFSRVTQIDRPSAGASTWISYNDAGLFKEERTRVSSSATATPGPGWSDKYSFFDDLNRLSRTFVANARGTWDTVDITYDGMGNTSFVSAPYWSTGSGQPKLTSGTGTVNSYDGFNRLTKISHTFPGGADVEQFSYSGRDSAVTDEANKTRFYRKDAFGRLRQVCEFTGSGGDPACGLNFGGHGYLTTYNYDANDNLLSVNQQGDGSQAAKSRTFTYDGLSRLLTATNPESGVISYFYDGNGNLLQKVSPTPNQAGSDQHTVSYCYDSLNRVTGKAYSWQNCQNGQLPPGTAVVSYGYDQGPNGGGRLTSMSSQAAAEGYTYNALGRVVRQTITGVTGSVTDTVSATYDPAGNLTSLTYPSGRHVNNTYNDASRLTGVNFADFNGTTVNYPYVNSITRTPTGAVASMTYGNGVVNTVDYDARLRPLNLTATGGGQTFVHKTYGWLPNGDVSSITDALKSSANQSFGYDAINRLTTASQQDGGFNQSYSYDAFGNLLQHGNPIDTSHYTFNGRNQMVGGGIGYDAAGNMTATNTGQSLVYNAENEVTSVNGGAVANYTYGPGGERIRKDLPGGVYTEYVSFGGNVIAEKDQAGDWTDYIYAEGQRVAKADSSKNEVQIKGTDTAAWQYTWWKLVGAPAVAVGAGDKLYFMQYQQGAAEGGVALLFQDGSNSADGVRDQDGSYANLDLVANKWHSRIVDLSQYAGKTIVGFYVGNDTHGPVGAWEIRYADIALVRADGTVYPIYTGQPNVTFEYVSVNTPGVTGLVDTVIRDANVDTQTLAEQYYHQDSLGTSRLMTSSGGWPIWQGTFSPFGQEINRQSTSNHYKFTGKERDDETGLDYFGARYYGSNVGRFMSVDWADKPEAVPYSDLSHPQSLNLYSYVRNNPLNRTDPTGHYELDPSGCGGNNHVKCQQRFDKRANRFEKERQKDLKSKDPRVRAGAAAFGARGSSNGVHVGFADLSVRQISGQVDAVTNNGKGKLIDIEVTIDQNRSGGGLRETIAHEGTHVKDDLNFLTSFDFNTGKYDPAENLTHGQTEFNAFQAGAGVNREHGFGPNEPQAIQNFLNSTPQYRNILNLPLFNPNDPNFPQ